MKSEKWKTIERLFNEAALLPKEKQSAFVEEQATNDAEMREAVLRLLLNDGCENFFLDEPVLILDVHLMTADEDENLLEKGIFGHYCLLQVIGRGGMGVVYLAQDARLNRRVALKLLPISVERHAETVIRFRQEARAASRVVHRNVAHIYDFGEFEKRCFLAMEYVPGSTLRELIKDNLIDPKQAVDITLQIAAALEAAHRAGVVHRDIKPENVVVLDDGQIKVLDFGLAKIALVKTVETLETSLETVPGLIMGTTAYMSPEQIRGQAVSEKTDLWSLGVCLYEMLTKDRPFGGDTTGDIQAAILKDDPAPLPREFPSHPEFSQILRKLLSKNAAERFENANELIRELEELNKQPFEYKVLSGDEQSLSISSNLQQYTWGIHQLFKRSASPSSVEASGKKRNIFLIALGGLLMAAITASAMYLFMISADKMSPSNAPPVANDSKSESSQNPEAEREYQRGRYIWNKRDAKEMPKALAHFQKAIELDPGMARAYAGLADAYSWDGNPNLTREEKHAHVKAAAQRALAIDPNLAEARTTLAMALGAERDWKGLEREYRKAIESNPNYPTAHHWFAEYLTFVGRDDEAVAHINKALELDPLSYAILNDAITINWYVGRYTEAIAKAEKMIIFDARYEQRARLWLARLYAHIGNNELARKEFARFVELSNGKVSYMEYDNFYALIGDKEKALSYLKKAEKTENNINNALGFAATYALLGMKEEAFKYLEIAFENRHPSIVALAANPDFDTLRPDPRYWNLLERMNLAEFWKDKLKKPE